ncbi:ABC transporter related protein [Novosphingobium sp. Rr 2-17]|uniref:MacB family efflux pump subunit n=1 Tax=Novosphingobium sp. Rr 2-17 TaxID=555793 RepID=UPI000269A53F|nr:MacB family efflux pump subunit [Novosphingobium sp. Rr 2-17]EIZ78522.1 ABC transporter related protein [Novosphingobium sp. Rr 2-17]
MNDVPATPAPLLELTHVRREYPSGDEVFAALKDINLTIAAGEMVAIVGQSGSGKSTLMNILGCLDRPTSGTYKVSGRATSDLEPDELAALRREHFGFIFQRYHLLGDLSAAGNVEVPSVYAGTARAQRGERSRQILTRLGLAERMGHRPGQLSGGQQQRVSIARALMNGGEVIFADEPTGALDSASGEEVMRILQELHTEGHTIILVTHDMKVAEHAERIIEIRDGDIIADRRREAAPVRAVRERPVLAGSAFQQAVDRFREAFRMAVLALAAHKLRTFLTMLGIIIGIASVVSVVALGRGSQERILSQISTLGTNTLTIFPGKSFGDMRSGKIQTLKDSDASALAELSYVDSVTPSVSTSVTARYRNVAATAQVSGVGGEYFRVRGLELLKGAVFDPSDVRKLEQIAVIDENSEKTLFPNGEEAIGKVVVVGNVPMRVIGIVGTQQQGFGGSDSLTVYAPYTTVMSRMLGQTYLSNISVRMADNVSTDAAAAAVTQVLTKRHGTQDFFISNSDEIRQTITSATQTLTLLVAAIAVISLIVGGIGVMNIMLVSVTERTSEIGVRMAVGARQSDILQQFLIEAVLVCLVGGVIGVGLSMLVGLAFSFLPSNFKLIYSTTSIVAAFACSTLIGVVFGFLPARRAARLDPVDALSRD